MESSHVPVLQAEILEYLNCKPSGWYLDGTLGGGGHAEAILTASAPDGRLLGIDADVEAIERCQKRLAVFGQRVLLVKGNFKDLDEILIEYKIDCLAGIALDLGLSSDQLEDAGRGFSFQSDGPLDMRQDKSQKETAADLVNKLLQPELINLFTKYGEERFSKRISRAIIKARSENPIQSALGLADIIKGAIPKSHYPRRIHPATKCFQALRIKVNRELEGLSEAVLTGIDKLAAGGRICVISYHSLEDRIIKSAFRQVSGICKCPSDFPVCICGSRAKIKILTKKPVAPTAAEQALNSRSRSAKLRVAQKLPEAA